MSRWGTILLILLAAGAAFFLVVVEPRLHAGRASESQKTHLVNVDPLLIEGLRIHAGSDTVELTRRPDGWLVGPDPVDHADAAKIGEILLAASEMEVIDIIPAREVGSEKELRKYGLSDPRNRIEILGADAVEIRFGREAVGADRVYAQVSGDDAVYVVSHPLDAVAFVDRQAFRDPRLTRHDADRIDRLVLRRPNGEIELERTARGWRIVRPLQVPADDEHVDGLLRTLLGARIDRFGPELASTSFAGDRSQATEVILYPDHQEQPDRMWLRATVGDDGNPVTQVDYPARKSVFFLSPDFARIVQLPPEEIRDRRLAPLNLDTIDQIRIEHGGDRRAVWRRSAENWVGNDPAAEVPGEVMETAVRAITQGRVGRYQLLSPQVIENVGLENPEWILSFDAWVSENTPEAPSGRHPVVRIRVGKPDGDRVPVQINDAPEVAWVDAAALRDLVALLGGNGPAAGEDVAPPRDP